MRAGGALWHLAASVIEKFQNRGWVMVAFSRSNAEVLSGAFCYTPAGAPGVVVCHSLFGFEPFPERVYYSAPVRSGIGRITPVKISEEGTPGKIPGRDSTKVLMRPKSS